MMVDFNRLPIDQPEFYPAEGDGPTGAEYEFVDHDVSDGIIYYYKLEAFGLDNSTQFFGPISANLGDTRYNTIKHTNSNKHTNTLQRKHQHLQKSSIKNTNISVHCYWSYIYSHQERLQRHHWVRTAIPSRTPFSTAKPETNTPRHSGSQESTPSATTTIAPKDLAWIKHPRPHHPLLVFLK